MKLYLGIDPGASGAIVGVDEAGSYHGEIRLDNTFADIANGLAGWWGPDVAFALMEDVHSMPKQGVASSFKFGKTTGFLLGLLHGYRIRHELITPQKWQKAMGCLTHGDKNISKAAAQRLFPNVKVIHQNADALLLAELGRRMGRERGW